MTKKLNTSDIINELRGASPFFPSPKEDITREVEQAAEQEPQSDEGQQVLTRDTTIPRHHDTVVSRNHETMHDTTTPQTEETSIEAVRKAVKQIGREPATQRLTLEEKQALKQIERHYEDGGIITSSNEITRIGLHYLLDDYKKTGENSFLARVLKRLHS